MGEALGTALLGVYVTGSVALGQADDESGLDFLAVVTDTPGTPGLGAETTLRETHRRLRTTHAGVDRLQGSYAPVADLRSPMTVGRRWLSLAEGESDLGWTEVGNTAHGRWVAREHGLVVTGPPAASLISPVTDDALRAEALGLARQHAERHEDDPGWYDDARRQPAFVLGSCRVLHTAATARVTGGVAAARWALDDAVVGAALSETDHLDLVRDAIADRTGLRARGGHPARTGHAVRTRAFAWDVARLAGQPALSGR